mgnify:CR=1 FL=1
MNPQLAAVPAAAAAAVDRRSESDLDRLLQGDYSPRYMLEGDSMDKMLRLAEQMACSKLSIPEHLRGNVGDCLAIITQAMLWNMNPFAVAQKTHVVSGRLGYEAQLVIAVVQNSGAIRGAFRFESRGSGANVEVRAGAVLRGETEITWGEWLSAASVTTKNSPLWKTNVVQQMSYLQAKNWSRLYCPGAILGVYSIDELEDSDIPARPSTATSTATPAPAPRPELPAYPAADFDKNLPAWTKLVADGKKTASALLAMLQTKATFNEEQKARILSLKLAAEDATPAPAPAPVDREPGSDDDFVRAMEAAEGAAK